VRFPGNDPYRNEPRFRAALERMGLGWASVRDDDLAGQ
jgi:hypothetical protein